MRPMKSICPGSTKFRPSSAECGTVWPNLGQTRRLSTESGLEPTKIRDRARMSLGRPPPTRDRSRPKPGWFSPGVPSGRLMKKLRIAGTESGAGGLPTFDPKWARLWTPESTFLSKIRAGSTKLRPTPSLDGRFGPHVSRAPLRISDRHCAAPSSTSYTQSAPTRPGEICATSSKFGRGLPGDCRIRPNVGRFWANFGRLRWKLAQCGPCRPNFGRTRPKLSRLRTRSCRIPSMRIQNLPEGAKLRSPLSDPGPDSSDLRRYCPGVGQIWRPAVDRLWPVVVLREAVGARVQPRLGGGRSGHGLFCGRASARERRAVRTPGMWQSPDRWSAPAPGSKRA